VAELSNRVEPEKLDQPVIDQSRIDQPAKLERSGVSGAKMSEAV
jgi:hypothetical protein